MELGGSIVPRAAQLLASCQRLHARGAGPVARTIDEAFLAPVLENVLQARDGGAFIRHHDGTIAATPEPLTPAMEATYYAGNIPINEGHEGGHLRCIVNRAEKMNVIAQHDEGVNADPREKLRAPDYPENQVVHFLRRT
jgi:hypothetical protein